MIIAVDFDGTMFLLDDGSKIVPFAIATLKQLQAERHLLILWSVREGKLLEEAVEYCRTRGVEFYAVNANHPDEQVKPDMTSPCRKVKADLYIGKLPDWGAIYEMIHNRWSYECYLNETHDFKRFQKASWWKKLINKKNTHSKYERE